MKYVIRDRINDAHGYIYFTSDYVVTLLRYPRYATKFNSMADLLNTVFSRGHSCEGRKEAMFSKDCEIVILEDE